MKTKTLYLIIVCVLVCSLALGAAGCKSEEELANAYSTDPTVISPDVKITQETEKQPQLINVSGKGVIKLEPDTAAFNVRITSEDSKPEECQAANAATVQSVTDAMIAAGVQQSDIQTQEAYLEEVYNYDKTPAVLTGYRMTTTLYVEVSPIDIAGKVIGAAVAAGATGTYGLTFTVSDTSGAYQQALEAAIEDAASKADTMSKALGVGIYKVPYLVNEVNGGDGVVYNYDKNEATSDMSLAESATQSTDTPISIGEVTVTANVSVSYEMYELTEG